MYSNTYTQMDAKDILPDIIIDDSADDYVETDEESEDEPEPQKSRPPASEIFAGKQPIEVEVEIESEEESQQPREEPQPVAQLEIQPIAKPKRQASNKQKEHLARIRVKAVESRRQKAAQKKSPPAQSIQHPTFTEQDVDRLLDRYKERRKAKKPKPKRNEDSLPAEQPLHNIQPMDDPWADCFL